MTVEYPDLSTARAAVTALMVDDFTVTEDPQGADDDSFDYTTATFTPPANDTATVYAGKGKIRLSGTVGAPQTEGERTYEATDYIFSAPITSSYVPKVGQVITCTGSVRDATLVGKQWIVTEPLGGTFSVSRKARCELRQTPDGAQ